MKKLNVFALLILLIGQTILGPIGTAKAAADESDAPGKLSVMQKDIIVKDVGEIEEDTKVTLVYEWILEGSFATGSAPIPDGLIVEDSSGTLEEVESGTYQAAGNVLTVTVNDSKKESANGVIKLDATVKEQFTFAGEDYLEKDGTNSFGQESGTPADGGDPAGENPEGENETPTKDESPPKDENGEDAPKPGDGKGEEEPEDKAEGDDETDKDKDPPGGLIITDNILTGAEITVYENESSNTSVESVTKDSLIKINYTFELKERHGYEGGATFTFKIPDEVEVYKRIETPLMNGGKELGTFTVEMDGSAQVVFTDFIKENSNVRGTLEVLSKISETTVISEDKKITITPISGVSSFTFPIIFTPTGGTIDKSGTPDNKYNGKTINWEVNFNKDLNVIQGAVLEDIIQQGQELKAGTLKLYNLKTKLNEEVEQGKEIENITFIGDVDFSIALGDISSAYRLVYTTIITNADQSKFENKAVLKGDDTLDAPATATVTIERGKPLEKRSTDYDGATQTITWEIKYNYNEKSIEQTDAILIDSFNKDHSLVPGSLTVERMSIDQEGQENSLETVEKSAYSVTGGANGNFTLQFNNDIKDAYKITYKTKADGRVYEGDKVINKVTFDGETISGSRDISQQILSKEHTGKTDYNKKTTTWKIELNKDSYEMEKVVLEDKFSNGGLELLSLEISGLEADTDYSLEINEGEGFTIKFLKPITAPHTITYTTKFDYDKREDTEKAYLLNTANLTWEESGVIKHKTDSDKFFPDEYTTENGFKSGSYNAETKEITWTVGVNYNLRNLADAKVIDEIQGNQQFVEGSIVVYKAKLTGGANGAVKKGDPVGKTINLEKDTAGVVRSFEIELRKIDGPYIIEYKTTLENQQVKKTYDNTAILKNGTSNVSEVTASVTIPNGGHYVSKGGTQKDRIIEWGVPINYSQSTIHDFRLTDIPSENQMIVEKSFKLYKTTVSEEGEVEKTEQVVDPALYERKFGDDGGFTLTFAKIDSPYVLEYSSIIMDKPGETITNDITYEGKEIKEATTIEQTSILVKQSSGNATIEGVIGSLTVSKVDADKQKSALAGAEFVLRDLLEDKVIATKETDSDGKVVFENLLYGPYSLEETSAPSGYLLNVDSSQELKVAGEEKVTVENEKAKQAVKLKKVDKDKPNKVLPGAQFELFKKEGQEYKLVRDNLVTSKKGIIQLNKLEPGDYQFIEKEAPEWYDLDKTPIKFTIKRNENTIVSLTKGNQRKKGKLIVRKVDAAKTTELLPGAVFELSDSDGNVIERTTVADEKLIFEEIPYGDYKLSETKAPEGYFIKADEAEQEVALYDDSVELTIKNHKIVRSFKLTKVDSGSQSKKLKAAEFTLQMKNIDGKYEKIDLGRNLITDENGEILLEGLDVGEYQLIETKAPTGYVLDKKPIDFTIEEEQIIVKEAVMKNRKKASPPPAVQTGGIKVMKTDAETSKLRLADAEFAVKDSKGNIITVITTDSLGVAVAEELEFGEYTIEETKAPEGYELTSAKVKVSVNKAETIEISIKNTKLPEQPEAPKGKVSIVKVDAEDATAKLANAVFVISNKEGFSAEITTNQDGIATVTDLPFGTYSIKEVKAPAGYQLTSEVVQVNVNKEDVIEVVVKNKRATGTPTVPGKPGDPTDPGKPEDPTDPGKPEDPTDPGKPGDPTDPTDPTDPGKPGDPTDPGKPDEPADPDKPGKPTDPDKPTDPGKPTDPTKPGRPDEPTDPNQPGTPTDPGKPSDPTDPGNPTDPGQQETPTDPDNPNDTTGQWKPADPAAPGKPGSTGTSETAGTAGNTGNIGDTPTSSQKGIRPAAGGQKLPQTGEPYPIGTIAGGIALILIGGWLLVRRKKEQVDQQ